MAQRPPTIAKHPFENLTGSPAASGRTARLSSGVGRVDSMPLHSRRASRLTFDMSGGWRQAKLAGRRPLDEAVRRLMEQSLVACHEREFATPNFREPQNKTAREARAPAQRNAAHSRAARAVEG